MIIGQKTIVIRSAQFDASDTFTASFGIARGTLYHLLDTGGVFLSGSLIAAYVHKYGRKSDGSLVAAKSVATRLKSDVKRLGRNGIADLVADVSDDDITDETRDRAANLPSTFNKSGNVHAVCIPCTARHFAAAVEITGTVPANGYALLSLARDVITSDGWNSLNALDRDSDSPTISGESYRSVYAVLPRLRPESDTPETSDTDAAREIADTDYSALRIILSDLTKSQLVAIIADNDPEFDTSKRHTKSELVEICRTAGYGI